MPVLKVHLADDRTLMALGERLNKAADGRLLKRVDRGIREELTGIGEEMRASAAERLPHRGGLAAKVASEMRTTIWSVRTTRGGSRDMSETFVQVQHRYYINRIDAEGDIVHPTFGHHHWVRQFNVHCSHNGQPVQGFLSDVMKNKTDGLRERVIREVEDFARDLERGVL